ncbi:site-specific integrase [Streptomyces sp. YIM 121038]|uniref:tyrosine-type recombinase/integrase n=1 Tax=Streptomyces sp. YIM 121038 TaxID=2136401 RepID=UPI002017727D|nr:site-specific integrase [Streptomyces sp. YIM 121038]
MWIEDRAEHKDYIESIAKWKASGKKRQPPGRWRVRWYDPQGKPKAKTYSTKPDAENGQEDITAKLKGGSYRDPSQGEILISALAEDWYKNKRRITERTKEDYREILDLYVIPFWGDWKISAIRWEDVDDWLTYLEGLPGRKTKTLSAGRIVKIYRVAGMVAKRAVQTGKITASPFKDHELPRTGDDGEHVYLTHEEVERLACAAAKQNPMFGTLIRLKSYTGPRWGEISAIKAGRLNPLKRTVRIVEAFTKLKGGRTILKDTKNHERRTLPVPAFLFGELKELAKSKGRDEFLFTGEDGALTYAEWRPIWRQAVKDAGLQGRGLTPHKLRHTAASLAIQAGANPKAVQKMLGHKSAALTFDLYAHLWDDDLDDVATALDARRKLAMAA